jgi:hypothetical protein
VHLVDPISVVDLATDTTGLCNVCIVAGLVRIGMIPCAGSQLVDGRTLWLFRV